MRDRNESPYEETLIISLLIYIKIKKSVLVTSSVRASSTQSHSKQWNVERYVSVALLAIMPASLIAEHPVMDYLLAASVIAHSTWGLKMIATDYIHGSMQAPSVMVIYALSILAFIGCCYFNYADIGLSKAVKKLWAL